MKPINELKSLLEQENPMRTYTVNFKQGPGGGLVISGLTFLAPEEQ